MLNEKPEAVEASADQGSFVDLIQNSYNNRFKQESPQAPDLYMRSITYDLQLIFDYILNDAPENSLVLIVGDHQPPLLPSSNYDTPFHVISKDSMQLSLFEAYGFTEGMTPMGKQPNTFTHAGIYSMLIDVLTPKDSLQTPLPTNRFRPEGVAPSVLLNSD